MKRFNGQEAYEFLETLGPPSSDEDEWPETFRMLLNDNRQLVMVMDCGDVLVSPYQMAEPSILVFEDWDEARRDYMGAI